jgi:hypothetical protein
MHYLIQKRWKTHIDCFDDDWKPHFCSNYSWKVSEKQTELRNAQPSLNTGSVLEGIKKLPGLIVSDIAGMM